MPISQTKHSAIPSICAAMLIAAPALSACHHAKPPAAGIPAHNKNVTPFEIDGRCKGIGLPKKKYLMIIDNLNINHIERNIIDEHGRDAKYPIKDSPYNTLYDIDLTDVLKSDGDAAIVSIMLKDKKVRFSDYPDQVTSGDYASWPMFCGLTPTVTKITTEGKSYPYLEFVVKYAKGAGDANHIGNFNINLVAPDSMDQTYSLPFSLDPHVGNNG